MNPRDNPLSPELRFVALCVCWPLNQSLSRQISSAATFVADWSLVLAIGERHRVVALVYRACYQAGVILPPEISQRLAASAKAATGGAMLLASESLRLQKLFERTAVPVLFLKGSALAALAYGEVGLRHSKDIDVLIDPADFERATDCLEAAGYIPRLPPNLDLKVVQSLLLQEGKSLEWRHHQNSVELELHWRFTDLCLLQNLAPMPPSRAVQVIPGSSLPTLQSDDLLAYLCVHGGAHAWSRLKWLADVYSLLPRQDPFALERLYRESLITWDAGRSFGQALLLCHEFFALQLAPSLLRTLRSSWRLRLATRLARKVLLAGGGAVEIYDLPFMTSLVYLSRFLLGTSWQFFLSEIRNVLTPLNLSDPATSQQRSSIAGILRRITTWIVLRWHHRGRAHLNR